MGQLGAPLEAQPPYIKTNHNNSAEIFSGKSMLFGAPFGGGLLAFWWEAPFQGDVPLGGWGPFQ